MIKKMSVTFLSLCMLICSLKASQKSELEKSIKELHDVVEKTCATIDRTTATAERVTKNIQALIDTLEQQKKDNHKSK